MARDRPRGAGKGWALSGELKCTEELIWWLKGDLGRRSEDWWMGWRRCARRSTREGSRPGVSSSLTDENMPAQDQPYGLETT